MKALNKKGNEKLAELCNGKLGYTVEEFQNTYSNSTNEDPDRLKFEEEKEKRESEEYMQSKIGNVQDPVLQLDVIQSSPASKASAGLKGVIVCLVLVMFAIVSIYDHYNVIHDKASKGFRNKGKEENTAGPSLPHAIVKEEETGLDNGTNRSDHAEEPGEETVRVLQEEVHVNDQYGVEPGTEKVLQKSPSIIIFKRLQRLEPMERLATEAFRVLLRALNGLSHSRLLNTAMLLGK